MIFSDLRFDDCFIKFRDIFTQGNDPVAVYKKIGKSAGESNALSPIGVGVEIPLHEQIIKLQL